MGTADRIADKLTAALSPATLEIVDESAQHAGHAGARPGGETHFRVRIVAAAIAAACETLVRQRLLLEEDADRYVELAMRDRVLD